MAEVGSGALTKQLQATAEARQAALAAADDKVPTPDPEPAPGPSSEPTEGTATDGQ